MPLVSGSSPVSPEWGILLVGRGLGRGFGAGAGMLFFACGGVLSSVESFPVATGAAAPPT